MGFKFYAPASLFLLLLSLPAFAYGWGVDGHAIICQIAQDRLSDPAAAAVEDLLPNYAKNNLSRLCSWADRVKFRYRWSSPLHYIDTPDGLCTYDYDRDCKDEDGVKGRCVSGGITNYTNQLLDYGNSSSESQYNLTEALLFLAHLMGDVHQVLPQTEEETPLTSAGTEGNQCSTMSGMTISLRQRKSDSTTTTWRSSLKPSNKTSRESGQIKLRNGRNAATTKSHVQTYTHLRASRQHVIGHTRMSRTIHSWKMTIS
uniref:Aspergillus nuclease S1 n=1 Tax=Musa acuminata subsp. malaccensis TaxID=214687 RepID=A0A804L087_MUSAM